MSTKKQEKLSNKQVKYQEEKKDEEKKLMNNNIKHEVDFSLYDENNNTWSCTSDIYPHPHMHIDRPLPYHNRIIDSVLEAIGNTPMIRLNRFKEKYNIKCDLVAKCEYFNAGGSIKDRIGIRMVEEAEKAGIIKPGDTLIEPTSGNTGIGLSLTAAIKNYKMIITLPEKMSDEKLNIMKLLGAEIIRTPTEAAWNSPESHIGVALSLQKKMKNAFILDQYRNPSNPLAHYEITAEEIIEQCDGKIDMIIMGVGTGGTLTGIGRKIREKIPHCIIIGVDPVGSILAQPHSLNIQGINMPYLVEGIGYDFFPAVYDKNTAHEYIKTTDEQSFKYARELILLEGLLCGGSSGAAMFAAIQKASLLNENQRCVVILPDSCRNYMSKFISDNWMKLNGFLKDTNCLSENLYGQKLISDLKLSSPITVLPDISICKCIQILYANGIDQVPVVRSDGEVIGVLSEGNVVSYLNSGRATMNDDVTKAMYKNFKTVPLSCPLSEVSRILDITPFVLVTLQQNVYTSDSDYITKHIVSSVVTRIDLLKFLHSTVSS